MEIIKYQILQSTLENGDIIATQKELPYTESNEEIAKAEAYKGEYVIEDNGQPETDVTPSQFDVLEAQVTYTAMMTDTLLGV